ncbi:hypothetical protein ACFV2N_47930 [Streptomyces sp. NPDC059680]|uniref:hypothetical protein n=1 Tax=Streptomyces sp. NPDC059680 TaxID=3346904 RepID=UPI003688FC6B
MPKAQAFDGNKPLSSIKEVTNLCSRGKGCRFLVDGVEEYRGGVISVSNSFLNCTDHDVDVSRSITFSPRITDNIDGSISGTATRRGTITSESRSQLSGTAEGTETVIKGHETWTPIGMNEATSSEHATSETTGTLSGTITGTNSGSRTADQSFEKEAHRNYSRTWDNSVDTETSIYPTVPPGDVLTLGYVGTGHRVKGTLKALGTSKYVKDVVVDEPSIMESGAFVAQTYTAPRASCIDDRPTAKAERAALFRMLTDLNSKTQGAFPSGQSSRRK